MKTFIYLSLLIGLLSCNKQPNQELLLLSESAFKTEIDGKAVNLYTLKSASGLTMQVTNLGARVVTLWVPDKNGKYEDVVLGYETIDRYINNKGERFLGPIVGRYANRIAKGQFELDGATYQLPINNNGQTLHGGLKGLDMVVWNVDKVTDNEIQMSYVSPDGEEGFPGTMKLSLTYMLTPENEFKITYAATTDKATVINLSHHGLFNLKGEGNGTITDHILTINASNTTPVDSVLIPSGEIASVEGTPFDFRKPTVIGERINAENEQLKNGAGYDHNWVIDRKTDKDVEFVASIYEPVSGRKMEVWSDQPGVQFYSGNFFDGAVSGKYGKPLKYREAFALETQHFPDSPNHPNFPTTRLNPGETYTQTCIYKFSIQK
ncbi:galactose mutarotase [Dysgonomonas sp. HDW5B]|uniref:aldose epimerase family protein n=1 Tax=Dysgonomonas sp. HDW5B TaxID=2714927 RepID=UPI00140E833F|nr:aldose epimerase family protein [Dysgonomonas sp. HDW5B]QIK52953.1 galactose mutarotase [Dysgonomonas sp. HDW5B]